MRENRMRRLARLLCLACLVPATAHASGGFELDEQSAASVGMAGAHTAVANDPAAIYFNPAGLALQPGFGALLGGHVIVARTHISPDNITLWHPAVTGTMFVAQRFLNRFSVGVGAFSNFGEHFDYPRGWRGRFVGYFIDITTLTINPTLALRIVDWLAVGGGVDIVPASLDLYRAINFGGGEGSIHVGMTDVGVGGNVGVLARLFHNHLNLGVSYRTRINLEFEGDGAISAPAELRAATGGLQRARVFMPLPHNFAIGLAGFVGHLVVSAEVKVTIWSDLQQLTLTLTDPAAGPGMSPTTDTTVVNFHDTWALRAGAQYGFLDERLRVRLGGGYDTTPVPLSTLGPLAPDCNRALVSVGVGLQWRWLALDAGYLAVFLIERTSTNPDLKATYETFGQVISASATVRLPEWWDRPRH
jgi:long-chain fatty acid transport protein